MTDKKAATSDGQARPNTPEVGGIAGDRLKSYVERIERLSEERAAFTTDIREVFMEAKSAGFDVKILRRVVALRKLDDADRRELEELTDLYMRALGVFA